MGLTQPETEHRAYYAARLREVTDGGEPVERLVLIDAASPADARRESGLLEADFHLASDAEVDEWDERCERPFTVKDLGQLVSLVRREQRALANKRARDRTFGEADPHGRGSRYKARKLAELRGRLELLLDAAEDEAGITDDDEEV